MNVKDKLLMGLENLITMIKLTPESKLESTLSNNAMVEDIFVDGSKSPVAAKNIGNEININIKFYE